MVGLFEFCNLVIVSKSDEVLKRSLLLLTKDDLSDFQRADFKCLNWATRHRSATIQTLD